MNVRASFVIAAALCLLPGLSAHAKAPEPLTRDVQAAIDATLAAHPEIPSISLTIHSPRNGIDWTGLGGKVSHGGAPVTQPLAFRVASVTKVFVAATLLSLAEQGRLHLADPISARISPETAAQLRSGGHDPDAILLRHVMEHTSGLPEHTRGNVYIERILKDPQHRWTRAEQIAIAMDMKPVGAPGEAYSYSDTGYVILGEVIERATGKPLAAAVREHARLNALGADATWWETLEPVPAGAPSRFSQYIGRDLDTTDWHPAFDLHGGGGLVSTTPDLARWFEGLLKGRLFTKPETMAMALATPHVRNGEGRAAHAPLLPTLLLGRHQCWSHGGFFGTTAVYCPDIDTAVVLQINMNTAGKDVGAKALLEKVAASLDAAGVR